MMTSVCGVGVLGLLALAPGQVPLVGADAGPVDPFAAPAGARSIYVDQDVFVTLWAMNNGRDSLAHQSWGPDYVTNTKSNATNAVSTVVGNSYRRQGFAAGRVTRQDRDQYFSLQRVNYHLNDANGKTKMDWWVSNSAARVNGSDNSFPTPISFSQWIEPRNEQGQDRSVDSEGALAVGDLDYLGDPDGNFRDELVVVTETADRKLEVRVYNYTFGATPVVTSQTLSAKYAYPSPVWWGWPHGPGQLLARIGDFDGTGKRQIAVVYHATRGGADDNYLVATFLDYKMDGVTRTGTLTQKESVTLDNNAPIGAGLEAAVGDFLGVTGARKVGEDVLGLGREQLAVFYHSELQAVNDASGHENYVANLNIAVLDRDPAYTDGQMRPSCLVQLANRNGFNRRGENEPSIWAENNRRQHLGLAAGVFKIDLERGFTPARKQLLAAYPILAYEWGGFVYTKERSYSFMRVQAIELSAPSPGVDGSGRAKPGAWTANIFSSAQTRDTDPPIWQAHTAAGNVCGSKADPKTPYWTGLVATMTDHGAGGQSVATVHRVRFDAPGRVNQVTIVNPGYNDGDGSTRYSFETGPNTPLTVTPVDVTGRSLLLGLPARITLNNVVATNYVLQEPPKHIDYLPLDERANARGIVNVSVDPGFNVTYTDDARKDVGASAKDTTGNTYGNSEKLNVGATLSFGDLKIAGSAYSVEMTQTFAYAYTTQTEKVNSTASSYTTSLAASTSADDALSFMFRTIDVYRYPLYGRKGDAGEAVYYDLSIPRPNAREVRGDGSSVPFDYAPSHQNGNALTYPILGSAAAANFVPSDLGPWTRPDPSHPGQTVQEVGPLNSPTVMNWNGNAETTGISWGSSATSSATWGYNKTLSASNDFALGYVCQSQWTFFGTNTKASFSTTNSGSDSWGKQTVNTGTVTRNQSLTLRKTSGDSTRSYRFLPLFYVTRDGTIKMASATDFSQGTGASWWASTYAGPDAALNLPYRFVNTGGGWDFNIQDNARQIRGARVYHATPTALGELVPISGPAPRGTNIILEVRVHNLSLGTDLGKDENGASKPVKVRFDLVPYDPVQGVEFGTRTTLGTATVQLADYNFADPAEAAVRPPPSGTIIPPRAIGRARLTVDTTALAPTDGTRREYRVYAVVDPDNEIRWRRADSSVGTQTHVWRRTPLMIRLKNAPAAGVTVKLDLQDAGGHVLESVSATSAGAGQAAVTAALAAKLAATATFQANGLVVNPDAGTPGSPGTILVSHKDGGGMLRLKPSTEFRGGVVINDGSPSGKAIYIVPTVTGDAGVTTASTVVVSNDSPAQNKEGWFPLAVMSPVRTAANSDDPIVLSLAGEPLAAVDDAGRLVDDAVTLQAGQTGAFRVRLSASDDTDATAPMLFFLGDPARGGTLLGTANADGVDGAEPTHRWVYWPLPMLPGQHRIFAQVAGHDDEAQATNFLLTLVAPQGVSGTSSVADGPQDPPPAGDGASPTGPTGPGAPPPANPPAGPGQQPDPLAFLLNLLPCPGLGLVEFTALALSFAAVRGRIRRRRA